MATTQIAGLPPGYTLDAPQTSSQSIVPSQKPLNMRPDQMGASLPEGYTLDKSFAEEHPYLNEAGRLTGISARSLLPYAAGAATGAGVGAGLGALTGGPGELLTVPGGAMAGVGAVGASQLYDMAAGMANHYADTALPIVRNGFDKVGDFVGLPKRETYSMPERYLSTGLDTLAAVGSGAGAGSTFLKGTKIGTALTKDIGKNVVSGLGAGAAAQTAGEAGVSDPATQLAFGVLGGAAPGMLRGSFIPKAQLAAESVGKDYAANPQAAQSIDKINKYENFQNSAKAKGVDLPQALTGSLTDDSFLKGVQTDVQGDQAIGNRNIENQKKLNAGVSSVIDDKGNPYAARPFIEQLNTAKNEIANRSVTEGQKGAEKGAAILKDEQGDLVNSDAQLGANASKQALGSINKNYADAKTIAEDKYSKVDQTGFINYDASKNAVSRIMKQASSSAESGKLPSSLKSMVQDVQTGDDGLGPVDKLLSLRRALGDSFVEAKKAGNNNTARLIKQGLDGIDGDLANAENGNAPLKEANKFYHENIGKVFLNDAQGDVHAGTVKPTETIGHSMDSIENAQQLKKALKYDGSPEAQKNVRDYWMDRLAQSGANKTNPTSETVRGFMKNNGAILQEFPEVKTEFNKYANQLSGKSAYANKLTQELEQRKNAAENTSKKVEGSIETKFAADPVATVGEILSRKSGQNMAGDTQRLLNIVDKDKTGRSRQAVEDALKEHLANSSELRNTGGTSHTVGEKLDRSMLNISFDKANKLFTDPNKRNLLEKILPKKGMDTLDQYHRAMNVELGNSKAGVVGSNTSSDIAKAVEGGKVGQAAKETATAASHALGPLGTAGRIAANTASYVGKLWKSSDPVIVRKLKVDATLDYKLARALMTDPNSEAGASAAKVIQKWKDANDKQGTIGKIGNQLTKDLPNKKINTLIGAAAGASETKKVEEE